VRPALALVLLFAMAALAADKLPTDGQFAYTRDGSIHLPFELSTNGPTTKVVLYYSLDGGDWQEHDSVRPAQKKGFLFKADREGTYAFATMTHFSDGRTDPPRKEQLTEQKRVVFDKTPPTIHSLRAVTAADGAPGIEWEVIDPFLAPRGVKLEFRWDGQGAYRPLDEYFRFGARDARHWKMATTDRMQVRVVATDRAGNKTESDPVWVPGREGDPVPRPPSATGTTSGARDPDLIQRVGARGQPTLHYVNTKTVKINVNAKVGPSGFTAAHLYWADDKLEWKKHDKSHGPKRALPSTDPDKPRYLPVSFEFNAPRDGIYHFISVVENHLEASRPEPKKGETGDLQVVVDTTEPEVQVLGTKVSSNGDRGAVVSIKWKATDANIAPVPIKLEYQAIRPDRSDEKGEWKAITPDWIDNTGQHTWPAPTGDAYEFMIRVTCRDRAGNEKSVVTVKPVNVDMERPRVDYADVVPGKGGPSSGFSEPPGMSIEPGIPPKR